MVYWMILNKNSQWPCSYLFVCNPCSIYSLDIFFFSHGTIKFGVELLFVSALVLWSDPSALLFMHYVNHNLRKQSFSLSTDIMLKIINGKTSHLFFHHSWFFFFNLVSSHCHWQNNYLLCLDVTLWMQCVNLIYSP